MYISSQEKHPFHLVDPSPWPALAAYFAFSSTLGLVLWFHGLCSSGPLWYLVVCWGPGGLLWVSYRWFQDILTESVFQGHHTRKVTQGLKWGMLLFLVSETMFFFSFFFAYFYYSGSPSIWVGGVWPPKGIVAPGPCFFPAVNTCLLLVSGVSLTWSHSALIAGDVRGAYEGLFLTLTLAFYFLLFQFLEYRHSALHMNDSVFGSIFFLITGFHGFHVLVGTVFLFICFCRLVRPSVAFTRQQHFGFMAALWYWHFVDVVWLFVFFILYVWGSLGAWVPVTSPDNSEEFYAFWDSLLRRARALWGSV